MNKINKLSDLLSYGVFGEHLIIINDFIKINIESVEGYNNYLNITGEVRNDEDLDIYETTRNLVNFLNKDKNCVCFNINLFTSEIKKHIEVNFTIKKGD